MIELNLAAVPNQSFSVRLGGREYAISVLTIPGGAAASIARDGAEIITGSRITPGLRLLPYAHQDAGNFVLVTEGEALPDYTQFGVTQFLVYLEPGDA
jgi:hypothetical protein